LFVIALTLIGSASESLSGAFNQCSIAITRLLKNSTAWS